MPPVATIPLFDLTLREAELAAVEALLRTGELTGGARVAAFETAFGARLGDGAAIATNSCSAALLLAYAAVGVGPGDEVVVPSLSFVATAAAVAHLGARPVFADVLGPGEPTLDLEHVAGLITPRTRAVACMHFGGYAARAHELRRLCDAAGLALVEDAAHAPAGTLDGRPLGTIGHVGCFSFFANKVLSAGEGGLLYTDDPAIAARARAAAADPRHRFDELRATLALARLEHLDADVTARRALTRRYRAALGGREDLVLPFADDAVATSACYTMPVVLGDPARRDTVRLRLRTEHAIQTSVLYPAIHAFTAYRDDAAGAHLPQTERCADGEISLPLYPELRSDEQDRVVAALLQELDRP